jgi:hypothetical protein
MPSRPPVWGPFERVGGAVPPPVLPAPRLALGALGRLLVGLFLWGLRVAVAVAVFALVLGSMVRALPWLRCW